MREAGKAMRRRRSDWAFRHLYFVGDGLDVGAGHDPIKNYAELFPDITSIRSWDVEDGDGAVLAGVAPESLDFVHSSHCLEHLEAPYLALENWYRVLKPGGYLICTVPDSDMYERGHWPSRFSGEHLWSFYLNKKTIEHRTSLGLMEMIRGTPWKIERIGYIRDNFDPSITTDQTLGPAECAIEFVLQRPL